MELNETVAPLIVKTLLLSFTLFTLFDTDPEDGVMVYPFVVDVNEVADTSSV